MKFVEEYRSPEVVSALSQKIHFTIKNNWTIMEICGGQTHGLLRYGLLDLLPPQLQMVHGPGCPVCVTDTFFIDSAITLSQQPKTELHTFGDMLRVPGTTSDLNNARAQGASVHIAETTLSSIETALKNPNKKIVFFGVGFETTVPSFAVALSAAIKLNLPNWSLLLSCVRVPPAIDALLSDPQNNLDGFLAAGHVCTIQGTEEYLPLIQKHNKPIVISGFEPVDLMEGILRCVTQLENGTAHLENAYSRAVHPHGNSTAKNLVQTYFEPVDRTWRGLGMIPDSGVGLKPEFKQFDALEKFSVKENSAPIQSNCQSAQVLTGKIKPIQCPYFGNPCSPSHPMGATMVSAEGACSAYFSFNKSWKRSHQSADLKT